MTLHHAYTTHASPETSMSTSTSCRFACRSVLVMVPGHVQQYASHVLHVVCMQGTAGMSKLAPGSEKETADVVAGAIPLQRMGERSDIGLACVYLASSAANYISGAPVPPLCMLQGGSGAPASERHSHEALPMMWPLPALRDLCRLDLNLRAPAVTCEW